MSKFKKVKTWKDILKDPRVDYAFHDSDGYWVDLHGEYYNCFNPDCRTIHEDTIAECAEHMNEGVVDATPEQIEKWYNGYGSECKRPHER
jgi:hypothetical protein|tara:strand:+ start:121 stop:390 length:270 start_codon:yes stop_codon:yes gene_type:complete